MRKFLPTLLAGAAVAPVALVFTGVVPAVRFVRERIEVTVRAGAMDVDGLYTYANPLPVPWTQGLLVPFAVDADHPAPATVLVAEADAGSGADLREIPVLWFRGRPHFTIRVPAFGTTNVRVRFTQPCFAPSATYLLTTTQPWQRPLERGEYILRPRGVTIQSSNYPLEAPAHRSFARQNFMPVQDWKLSWVTR